MAKDVWHKVENGAFEKDGKEYKFVIERNKNKPINTKSKNVRMRIVQEKPVVRRVRTRFDPVIQAEGDQDAVVPTYIGYDLKHLKPGPISLIIFTSMPFILIDSFFFEGRALAGVSALLGRSLSVLKFGPTIPGFLARGGVIVFGLAAVFGVVYIPFLFRYFKKRKLYYKVKKEGISYTDMHGMTGN
jgi:hypothetical protein